MDQHLFVYGTLKLSYPGVFGRGQRDRLHRESRFVGAATMAGRLHDLGAYPGVVDPIDPADIVHGELVELLDPTASFVWLDAYEGILPGALAASEYRRERRPVWLPGEVPSMATKVPAWVYIYAQGISGAPHVTSGIWQPA